MTEDEIKERIIYLESELAAKARIDGYVIEGLEHELESLTSLLAALEAYDETAIRKRNEA